MSYTYVYLMDKFYPIEFSLSEIAELYDEDHMKIFESIRGLIENVLESKVKRARLYKSFLSYKTGTILIEYMVSFEKGTIGVKIIHAHNPVKAIEKYYEAEKKGRGIIIDTHLLKQVDLYFKG